MSFPLFDTLPFWTVVASITINLSVGIALGYMYFRGVWWSTRRLVVGGRVATTIILTLGRFALLGGVLTVAGREGALPLLTMAFGVLVARSAVMRRVRKVV